MSDFDKEAEREKLREKFARDEEKRQETQRMSELLLKGATMTNKHCDRCGDPIFRFNGESFCPTCRANERAERAERPVDTEQTERPVDTEQTERPVDTEQAERSVDTEPASAADTASDSIASTETAVAADSATNAAVDESGDGVDAAADERPSPVANSEVAAVGSPSTDRSAQSPSVGQSADSPPSAPSVESPVEGAGPTDLSAARASLTRTITRFAQKAEATEDPRRARELLAAAREAAEALSALD
ncbi:Sjogren's syndrome/scleroderma autoantigen 1 family protein [Haloferacaceae archaeon DSL9]